MHKVEIRFGVSVKWEFNYRGEFRSWEGCGLPATLDLAKDVRAALANPIDFPAIEKAIIEGDRVAIVVDPLLPSMAELTVACIRYLIEKGVTPDQLVVVLAGHEAADAELLRKSLAPFLGESVAIELHDADDDTKVAYVAANEDSDPIYINRTVVDADVILPITCARGNSTLDYMGAYTVFPLLSNRATRGQFYALSKLDAVEEHEKLTAWADQAAWWVGMMASIQAVPAADDSVACVIAGSTTAVEHESQQRMAMAWRVDEKPAQLVIALLEGRQSQQSWENLARALHTAKQLVAPGGSIVLCTDIMKGPGAGLQKLRNVHNSPATIARKLAHETADDALAAAVILETTKNYHVYLVSHLKPETVEGLGMGVIQDAAQLEHLCQQHASCAVLGSAQHRFVPQSSA